MNNQGKHDLPHQLIYQLLMGLEYWWIQGHHHLCHKLDPSNENTTTVVVETWNLDPKSRVNRPSLIKVNNNSCSSLSFLSLSGLFLSQNRLPTRKGKEAEVFILLSAFHPTNIALIKRGWFGMVTSCSISSSFALNAWPRAFSGKSGSGNLEMVYWSTFTFEHRAVRETLKIDHFSVNCHRYSCFGR